MSISSSSVLFRRRCLSVQSHTVHGYVGNKAAVFPLQLLGFDVDPLNSVQLSNHTAYRVFKGQVLGGPELEAILAGLCENALCAYTHVLTGYVSAPTFLAAIARVVRDVRAINPHAVYVCDPVMGDHGKLYVPPELVPIYRDEIVPLATILTPNQFEAELLTGLKIVDIESCVKACEDLHTRGAKAVVITSSSLPAGQDSTMLMVASCPWDMVREDWDGVFAGVDRATQPHARFTISIPKLPSVFTGSGDLTAALILAHAQDHPHSFVNACERAIATVQAVCRRTMEHYQECMEALKIAKAKHAAVLAPDTDMPAAAAATTLPAAAAATTLPAAAAALGLEATEPSAWIISAAASSSGQMGSVIPVFNELQLIQSKRDIEHPVVPEHLRAKRI